MDRNRLLVGLAAWAATAGFARADVVFQRTLLIDSSQIEFESTTLDLDLAITDSFFTSASADSSTLFDDLQVVPGDVGRTFSASLISDAAFGRVAARMSDAQNEIVKLVLAEPATGHRESRGWYEDRFFMAVDPSGPPDLARYVIESVDLTIDRFRLDFGPSAGAAASSPPPVELIVTVAVNGRAVPEPQTGALAACGVGFLVFASRHTRRRSSRRHSSRRHSSRRRYAAATVAQRRIP